MRIVVGVFLLLVGIPSWGATPFDRPLHAVRLQHRQAAQMRAAGVHAATTAIVVDTTLPPEQLAGERLFFETRFAQFFATHYDGNVNHALAQGDPVVAIVKNPAAGVDYPGPFAGKSINCRSCHFVDEFGGFVGGGNRAYSDFVARSPIPDRGDGHSATPRNAMNMVDSFLARPSELFLHSDGEFVKETSLVKSTLTGRNFGWLPTEYASAVAHVAKVIREDDGSDELGQSYGGSYSKVLLGTDASIPAPFVLPQQYRIDVQHASDQEVFDAVANVIAAYMDGLAFSRDANGRYDATPYDVFLAKNGLPLAPAQGESDLQYSLRLLQAVNALASPKYVNDLDGHYSIHPQNFVFGPTELQGLKLFLRQTAASPLSENRVNRFGWMMAAPFAGFVVIGAVGVRNKKVKLTGVSALGVLCVGLVACGGGTTTKTSGDKGPVVVTEHAGNCVSCHAAPTFTDFRFHNTGVSQEEYDGVHGAGKFAALTVPSYMERQQNRDAYLPATPAHPNGAGVFRAAASASDARLSDLGLWNVYGNDDYPEPQAQISRLMCGGDTCDVAQTLPQTIGKFKTPSLRDLSDSGPYLHNGSKRTLEDVIHFYINMAKLSGQNQLRNGDSAMVGVSLDENDVAALAAFLRALNEDYD